MIYKSRAPFRIGFAGGGTDVSPYAEIYGGAVLNATISLYAHVSIEPTDTGNIELINEEAQQVESLPFSKNLQINGSFDLVKAVYNHFSKNFPIDLNGLRIRIHVDVPHGSGLGTSSTLVIALTGAFSSLSDIFFTKDEIAAIAFDIERNQLGWAGGKQDQYAAAFGGFNLMQFKDGEVNILRVQTGKDLMKELEQNLVLYYTDITRNSADIIRQQSQNVRLNHSVSINAMHKLKEEVYSLQLLLESGDISQFGELINKNFKYKKMMAQGISTPFIETIYEAAMTAGATGCKISGAGGGGFIMFYCPLGKRKKVEEALERFPGWIQDFHFESKGLETWQENS